MSGVLGVLGGMGPDATNDFCRRITLHTQASRDQDHVDVVVLNHATLPDRTAALESGETEELSDLIFRDVRTLESLGVEVIAMPCNTAHAFLGRARQSASVPIVDMVGESVREVAAGLRANAPKGPVGEPPIVGVLCTHGTILAGGYEAACAREGLRCAYPSPENRDLVSHVIYDVVKSGRLDSAPAVEAAADVIGAALADLAEQGCRVTILGCTDLSVLASRIPAARLAQFPVPLVDAMDALVRQAILRVGATYKE